MLHFSPLGMLAAIAIGFVAAAWLQEAAHTRQRRRRVARAVDEAEAAALWEHGEPSPTQSLTRLGSNSADARVAAAVKRAAEAEAEAAEAIALAHEATVALEEARRSATRGELRSTTEGELVAASATDASDDDWAEVSAASNGAHCPQCRWPRTVRNHVLVPCGHTACEECAAARCAERCGLCESAVQYALRIKDD